LSTGAKLSAVSAKKRLPNSGSSRPVAVSTNFWNSPGFGGGCSMRGRKVSFDGSRRAASWRDVKPWPLTLCAGRRACPAAGPFALPWPTVPAGAAG
jgi:hypothetical protein